MPYNQAMGAQARQFGAATKGKPRDSSHYGTRLEIDASPDASEVPSRSAGIDTSHTSSYPAFPRPATAALGSILLVLAMLVLVFLSRGDRLASMEREIHRLGQLKSDADESSRLEAELQRLSAEVEGLSTRVHILMDGGKQSTGLLAAPQDTPVQSLGVSAGRNDLSPEPTQ